jgi:hypothetical protein
MSKYAYLCMNDTTNGPVYRLETRKPTPRVWGKPKDTDCDAAWRMPWGLYRDGLRPYGWDVPTFRMQSDKIV